MHRPVCRLPCTIQRPGLMMVWEMAAESLLSRQQSRYASVLVGGSTYRAQISARTVTDTSAIFTPKFIFDLQDSEDEQPSNLQPAPSVRCGSEPAVPAVVMAYRLALAK